VTAGFNLDTQYWTSRGFAVLDVNYGGSSGFGRVYRNRLRGNWGVRDMQDAIYGALFLADEKRVDRKRMAIKGWSAGGYTTLCALAFSDVFRAGVSYFGLSDLNLFVGDTHKFEARYLDRLVGPYPEKKDLYEARSPLYHIEKMTASLLLLQGMDDPIVPPNQSQEIYDKLKKEGRDVTLLLFEGEKHGFKKAESIKKSYEAELQFYSSVFR
jgi:dipeptidyl aminopeptidase/acylaminoacyl peptidase